MHIGFEEQPRWTVEWITSPRFFVPALQAIMPAGSVLYLESYSSRSEFRPFIERHRAHSNKHESVYLACSDPMPAWTEHLTFNDGLVDAFERFFARWNFSYAEHVHGYHAGELLFWFHDAFSGGEMQINPCINASRVEAFCTALAPKARFEKNHDAV